MADAERSAGTGSVRVVMLGAPGSGKGTQAERLAERYGIPAISTGDMLRAAVAAGTELGARVEGVMASGALVADDLMAEVVRDRLAKPDAAGGFILDGYPRTAAQADTLEAIVRGQNTSLDAVIYLDVPEPVLVERAVARQRDDDREEVVRERIRVYREKTEPLVEHYRRQELLRTVDGDQTMDEVTETMVGVLEGVVA